MNGNGGASSPDASFPVVGIGASAGGLEAFSELLAHLPVDTGMGFVLVQHLDPQHESALTKLLGRASSLPVHEATNNLRIEPNHVYVIAPDTHLGIAGGVLTPRPRPQTRTPNRAIDHFFEALAQDQQGRAIGVILSGTATDGTLGLEAIKAEGGITFAQDDSAKYDSMPRSAVAAGCVDFVLSPANIAKELARLAKHPYLSGPSSEERATAPGPWATALTDDPASPTTWPTRWHAAHDGGPSQDGFRKILSLLLSHCGVDFSRYKSSTIQRRINRRMVLSKHDTLEHYGQFLDGNADELDALYTDMLISVTTFFRNPPAFEALQRELLRKLLQHNGGDPLRVWVLGCSTGQEAYSIAMALLEAADQVPRERRVQIFATDLNEALLEKARTGLYAKSLAQDVSAQRLRRFFTEEEGGYRVAKPLREMVVFARHNLIGDPPFSRMDLITCRNLLIYLEPELQKKVFPAFHYALKPDGVLWLGASESIGGFTELFEPVDKKHRIYVRKAAPGRVLQLPIRKQRDDPSPAGQAPMNPTARRAGAGQAEPPAALHTELDVQREADRITVNQFAPPAVLINADLQILQFRGSTGAYLEPAIGKATFDVLKMARGGLMLPLRAVINQAKKENRTARKENIQVEHDDRMRTTHVEVIPLNHPRERCFLVVFEDADRAGQSGAAVAVQTGPLNRPPRVGSAPRRIAALETELAEMRDYLRFVQEKHESAQEELQAANEEVESANEELQSLNEELETSKEELESSNEELVTVNEEIAHRNTQLSRLNNDLMNVETSTRQVIVLLDRNLAIRHFSVQAAKQFNLQASDVGQPIRHVPHQFELSDLEAFITDVIETVHAREREVQDKEGRWFSLRVRPYVTPDNQVEGAVVVLVDIDELKRSEQAAATARDYAENIIETVREPLIVLDSHLCIERANRAFYRSFRATPAETVGRAIFHLGNHQWDIPELRKLLQEILPHRSTMEDFSVERDFEHLGRRTMLLNAQRIHDPHNDSVRILLAIEDISERNQAEQALREADHHKDEFLAMLAHELRNPLAPMRNALEILRRAAGNEPASAQGSAASSLDAEVSSRALGRVAKPTIDMMERQIFHMVRLVDDLLDASRISRGKIELRKEWIDLASVVDHVVQSVRPVCDSMGHELCVTLPPQPMLLNADPTRLAQIIGNLVNNACKFTDRGGRIELAVALEGSAALSASPEDAFVGGKPSLDDSQAPSSHPPSQAVIRVRDTGIGIAADQRPRLFHMFAQIDSSLGRSTGGLGIGLALVKDLVTLHGGTVEVRSAGLGQGSEFTVRLPISTPAPEALAALATTDRVMTNPPTTEPVAAQPVATDAVAADLPFACLRILVVDDNRDSADSLAFLLELHGHKTHVVYDGLAAVEAVAAFHPDVVVLDIGLPKIDGYEAARRIRQLHGGDVPLLVALTGWGQAEDQVLSAQAGFDVHMVKPVEPEALMALLAQSRLP